MHKQSEVHRVVLTTVRNIFIYQVKTIQFFISAVINTICTEFYPDIFLRTKIMQFSGSPVKCAELI